MYISETNDPLGDIKLIMNLRDPENQWEIFEIELIRHQNPTKDYEKFKSKSDIQK